MNKRGMKALTLAVAVCLAIGLAVSSTLAYLVIKTSTLVNTFVPGNVPQVATLTVPYTITKTVMCTGDETIGPEGFRFALKDSVTGKDLAILTSDENGLARGVLTFTYDDIGKTYGYLLTEINDGRENVTYSEKSYYMQVRIMLDEAQDMLVPVLHMNGEVVYNFSAAFENLYYVAPPVPPTGDGTNLLLYAALLMASAVVLVLVLPRKREN